jgi:hypothetical protein
LSRTAHLYIHLPSALSLTHTDPNASMYGCMHTHTLPLLAQQHTNKQTRHKAKRTHSGNQQHRHTYQNIDHCNRLIKTNKAGSWRHLCYCFPKTTVRSLLPHTAFLNLTLRRGSGSLAKSCLLCTNNYQKWPVMTSLVCECPLCQQHTNAVIHNMHVPFILHKKIKYCFKWAQIKQMPPHFENKWEEMIASIIAWPWSLLEYHTPASSTSITCCHWRC